MALLPRALDFALLLAVLPAACLPEIQKGERPAGEGADSQPSGDNGSQEQSIIIATSPANGATGSDRYSSIIVTFSPSMDTASVESAFTLSNGSVDMDGSFTWNDDGTVVTFTPDGILAELTTYTASILASAKEASGAPMPADFAGSFTTAAAWTAVTAGAYFTLALRSDGTLWAWGWNNIGQLGLGDNIDRLIPSQVGSETDWVEVNAGSNHAMALKSDGT